MPLGKVRLRLEQRKEGEVTAARSDGSEPKANGTLMARSPVA